MNTETHRTTVETPEVPLVTFVQGLIERGDRGALALLRAALSSSEERQMRAWRVLAPFGGIPDPHKPRRAEVVRIVAGLMTLPKLRADNTGNNFGHSCRTLLSGEERKTLHKPDQPGPVSQRVQHLLAASPEEVCDRVCALARRIANADGNIDFSVLYRDLDHWNQRTKARWAAAFWGSEPEENSSPASEETKP